MKRQLIVAVLLSVLAGSSAQAQATDPLTGAPVGTTPAPTASPNPSSPGSQASTNSTNPTLSEPGLPCSGVPSTAGNGSTSIACGNDPFSVPVRTLSSPSQVNSSAQGVGPANGSNTAAGGAGSNGSFSGSSVCSSDVATTSGSTSVGSLAGGGC